MDSRRQQKIAQLIQEEFSSLMMTDFRQYLMGGFVTLTYVKVSPDLSIARFNFSVMNVEPKEDVIKSLNENKSEIRRSLGNRMRNNLRKIPELIFHLDDTLDYVEKMDELFERIKAEDEKI